MRQINEHIFERRDVAEVDVRGAGDVQAIFQSVADQYGSAVCADDGKPRRASR